MREITFETTRRCNYDCAHCLRDFSVQNVAEDLDLGLFERILDQAMVYGLERVALTGGEPTLHPRFGEFLDAIVNRGLSYHFVTNGSAFGGRVLPLIQSGPRREKLMYTCFSLEGSKPEINDPIRGNGTFHVVMRAVALCSASDIPFGFSVSIGRHNRDDIDQVCLMASHLGAKFLTFSHILPTQENLRLGTPLPLAEWREAEQDIDRMAKALNIPIMPSLTMRRPDPMFTCPTMAGDTLHVDWQGNLIYCCTVSAYRGDEVRNEVVANLAEVSLFDAHRAFMGRVTEHNLKRLAVVESRKLRAADYFPCLTCVRNHGQLDWTNEY